MNALSEVIDTLARYGMEPFDAHDVRIDGTLCRFDCIGDHRGRRNAWAVVFADGKRPVVCFGHWSRDIHETVVLGKGPLTSTEREQTHMAIEAAKRDREAEIARRRESARREAVRLWRDATPASASHPYLQRKGIGPEGLRQSGLVLFVPMYDKHGDLWDLQRIQPNGSKRFLRGGRVSGLYATIGQSGEHILICEGWATGRTLRDATRLPVVVAFACGNLPEVGAIMRRKYPTARLTIAADNDTHVEANPGVTCATKAARLVDGYVWVPPCAGDWNDYAAAGGTIAIDEVTA